MSNKKEEKSLESQLNDSLKHIEGLTKEAVSKLQKICDEMLDVAKDVKKDYDLDTDTLSEMSGSVTQIHEDSPFLDEIFKGDAWKKVIKTDTKLPKIPKINKEEDKKDDK